MAGVYGSKGPLTGKGPGSRGPLTSPQTPPSDIRHPTSDAQNTQWKPPYQDRPSDARTPTLPSHTTLPLHSTPVHSTPLHSTHTLPTGFAKILSTLAKMGDHVFMEPQPARVLPPSLSLCLVIQPFIVHLLCIYCAFTRHTRQSQRKLPLTH